MINIEVVQELMTDFGNQVFEILSSQYPEFLLSEYEDKLSYARLYSTGSFNDPEDLTIMNNWATQDGVDVDTWARNLLTFSRDFVKMKQGLSNLYKSSSTSVYIASTTAPETLPQVLQSVMQNAENTMHVFANGDGQILEKLLLSLSEMSTALQETLSNG